MKLLKYVKSLISKEGDEIKLSLDLSKLEVGQFYFIPCKLEIKSIKIFDQLQQLAFEFYKEQRSKQTKEKSWRFTIYAFPSNDSLAPAKQEKGVIKEGIVIKRYR